MDKRRAMRLIEKAQKQVNSEIRSNRQGFFGTGLATEGYAGGYRDALSDVILLLNGTIPDRRDYWEKGDGSL